MAEVDALESERDRSHDNKQKHKRQQLTQLNGVKIFAKELFGNQIQTKVKPQVIHGKGQGLVLNENIKQLQRECEQLRAERISDNQKIQTLQTELKKKMDQISDMKGKEKALLNSL